MLDPDIFPYTQVNGSTFPAADETMKNNTPPVSDPNYSTNIVTFVNTNVPDTFRVSRSTSCRPSTTWAV